MFKIGEGGGDDCPVCQFWLSEGRPNLDLWVGDGVNPDVFIHPTTTFVRSVFSGSILDTPRTVYPLQTRPQCWRSMGLLCYSLLSTIYLGLSVTQLREPRRVNVVAVVKVAMVPGSRRVPLAWWNARLWTCPRHVTTLTHREILLSRAKYSSASPSSSVQLKISLRRWNESDEEVNS